MNILELKKELTEIIKKEKARDLKLNSKEKAKSQGLVAGYSFGVVVVNSKIADKKSTIDHSRIINNKVNSTIYELMRAEGNYNAKRSTENKLKVAYYSSYVDTLQAIRSQFSQDPA